MKYNISKLITRPLFLFKILYYCVIQIITQIIQFELDFFFKFTIK